MNTHAFRKALVVFCVDLAIIIGIFVLQFRTDSTIIEKIGNLQVTLDCAHRELEEETGYYTEKENVEFLLSLYTTVAFCNEKIDIYVARGLRKTCQNLDDDEYIDVYAYTIDELTDMILNGTIVDAKTIAGLMSYKAKL